MLAPRNLQNNIPNRMGGLLGIPQMVAAGLLPPARQIAQDLESSMGGAGSIRRIPQPAANRFVYQSLRHNNNSVQSPIRGRSRTGYYQHCFQDRSQGYVIYICVTFTCT